MVDVLLVEQRLEDAVGEPQDEDVLDGLLSEVVIDSINLVLVEYFGDRVVDVAGALQIASDRLLDDQPRERTRIARGLVPRRNEPGTIQLTHCRYEKRRRHGQVVDAIA